MSLNKFMHPRNPYKQRKPNFKALAEKYPEFNENVIHDPSGKVFLDFKKPEALRALTKTLLKEDFDLDVELPQDRLVPTIPLRINYLLWIEDILGKKSNIRGIDIGTGSSCVYPLLGNRMNNWTFIATEVDAQNAYYAKKNVHKNNMDSVITVMKVTEDALISGAILDTDPSLTFDFCMCNPPFFADHMEAQAAITSRTPQRADPMSVSTASPKECISPGGEVGFIKQMIIDSAATLDRVKIYTSMVGKKTSLPPIKEALRKLKIDKFATTEFCQGKTMRWGVAWSFDPSVVFPKSPFQTAKNEKPPLSYQVPYGAGGAIYDVPSLTLLIKTLLCELQIDCKDKKCGNNFSSLKIFAFENTWSNQRRRRRQQLRADNSKGTISNRDALKGESPKGDKSKEGVLLKGSSSNVLTKKVNTQIESTDIDGQIEIQTKSLSDEIVLESNIKTVTIDGLPENGHSDEIDGHDCLVVEQCSDLCKRKDYLQSGDSLNIKKPKLSVPENASNPHLSSKELKSVNVESKDVTETNKARSYILKCNVYLRRTAGVDDAPATISIEMVWRDGESKELMHQVFQYLKNKLTPAV